MKRKVARFGLLGSCLVVAVGGLMLPVAAFSVSASSFHTLLVGECAAPAKVGYSGRISKGWAAFNRYVRACPLSDSPGKATRVWLLTIFAQGYRDRHLDQSNWPDFPRPMLVAADGHCLSRLPELFPADEPRTLTLRFGLDVRGRPGEIRVHVSNPAVGGDYDLPVLKWQQQQGAYVAQNDTHEYNKHDMSCQD